MFKNHNLFNPDKHIMLNERILLKIPIISDKIGSIIMADETYRTEQREVIKGELISFSEDAFKDWKVRPEKGDTVYFHLYAGRVLYDENDNIYRNMSSDDLTGFEKA